jgi:signal transduction histidine kinase
MADPTRIHQIFMNLCANAAQAMDEDGGILTIRLHDVNIEPHVSTEKLPWFGAGSLSEN